MKISFQHNCNAFCTHDNFDETSNFQMTLPLQDFYDQFALSVVPVHSPHEWLWKGKFPEQRTFVSVRKPIHRKIIDLKIWILGWLSLTRLWSKRTEISSQCVFGGIWSPFLKRKVLWLFLFFFFCSHLRIHFFKQRVFFRPSPVDSWLFQSYREVSNYCLVSGCVSCYIATTRLRLVNRMIIVWRGSFSA